MLMSDLSIDFRSLQCSDCALLLKWLNLPHVQQWWTEDDLDYPLTLAALIEKYRAMVEGDDPTRAYIILIEQTPIGYIQVYRLSDAPIYQGLWSNSDRGVGVDLYIGDPSFLHRGYGSRILRRFLQRIVFGELAADRCVVDPDPMNRIAIRAYEKAGFRYCRTMRQVGSDEMVYLMQIQVDEFESDRFSDLVNPTM